MSALEQSQAEEQQLLEVESGDVEAQSRLGNQWQRFRTLAVVVGVLLGLLAFVVLPTAAPAKPSESLQLNYDMIGSLGPNAFDIFQGSLGSCYALAGFAAVAKTHPLLIQSAAKVNTQLWLAENPVISSKWYIGGEPMTVAMDDMFPVKASGMDFSLGAGIPAAPRSDYHMWPMVLEKAYAKISGAYFNIHYGQSHEILQTITGAPVETHHFGGHKENCMMNWDIISHYSNDLKYPITFAVTKPRDQTSVPTGHAYAFLGTSVEVLPNGTEVKVATVYNPHGHVKGYTGALQGQLDASGKFSMLFDEEFCNDAAWWSWAHVVSVEHKVSHQAVNLQKGRAEAHYKFTITKPGTRFYIMVQWLPKRIREKRFNCSGVEAPVGGMLVKTPTSLVPAQIDPTMPFDFGLYQEFTEPGAYEVYLFVAFKDAVLPKIALNVYAPEDVTFEEVPLGNAENLCTQTEGCSDIVKQFSEQVTSGAFPSKCNVTALQHAEDFLNNAQEIQKTGYDTNFPPALSSISQEPSKGCGGDAAAGLGGVTPCEVYDNWKSLRDVMTARNQQPAP